MPVKLLLIVTMALILVSCGSDSSKKAVPIEIEKGTPLQIPDNSDADNYQIIIYGNSHSSQLGSLLEILITSQLPNVSVETKTVSGTFLDVIVERAGNVEKLQEKSWSHAIFQGQKYSQSGKVDYPTDAAQRIIKAAKTLDITPILFPEHPQRGDAYEGRRVYELHLAISAKEPSCVAPIGLIWDRLLAIMPDAPLYQIDGNHASYAGNVLTAMAFYEIITEELADMMPYNAQLNLSESDQALYAQIVTEVMQQYKACPES
ncbi:hypothetical protein [Glaciecola sp. MF2-115]|uniref:hypothetical protein n=1 Tax=Glaciecola sp. MF2-115 TaxID=3384827 RepID=UPI0039A0D714